MQALCSAFAIISGGAGTGKTYTLSRLVVMLVRGLGLNPKRIALVAPTGKAVNRLASSLKHEFAVLSQQASFEKLQDVYSQLHIQTIHRLLGIHPVDGRCRYDQERLLPFDCVILDEASMVDLALMHKLLRATAADTRVIIVGDPKQLPSVETGCLLADMVASAQTQPSAASLAFFSHINPLFDAKAHENTNVQEPTPSHDFLVSLQQVRRSEGALVSLAQATLNKDIGGIYSAQCEQFSFSQSLIHSQEPAQLNEILDRYIIPNVEKTVSATSVDAAWQSLHEYACLVPNRKGYAGVEWLNQKIEQVLSHRYSWIQMNKAYQGKAIMITQNDYSLGLYNGDIGIIWPDNNGDFWAFFPYQEKPYQEKPSQEPPKESADENSEIENTHTGKSRIGKIDKGASPSFQAYSLFTLPSYESVFAMTIHKTQGSEYQHVDIILPQHTKQYLSNELIYTALTRAKKSVRVFADKASFEQGVQREVNRVSGIANKFLAR